MSILLLWGLFACQEQPQDQPGPGDDPMITNPPVVGGWGDQNTGSDLVQNAAVSLVNLKLVDDEALVIAEITKAQTQVVAGYNIKLSIEGSLDGVEGTGEAEMYIDLQGQALLTLWEWNNK